MNTIAVTVHRAPWAPLNLAATLTTAVAGLVASAARAPADTIDHELIKHGPRLVSYLQQHQYRYVGVLKFRVKKGSEEISFNVGPLNTNMITRLEHLLVLASNPKAPVHLLTDPGRIIASKRAKLSYLSAQGRRELFQLKYPAVGGGRPVEADAFLTGRVDLSADFRQTKVTVVAFSRAKLTPEKVLEFVVHTDRNILGEVAQNFVLPRSSLENRLKDGLDEEALPGPVPVQPQAISKYVQLQVLYDGLVQEISADATKKIDQVAEPHEKQNVVLKIRNVSDKRLGVVLTVNGKNTVHEEEGELSSCKKWILDPNEEYTIRGYYPADNKTVLPFQVLPNNLLNEPMDPHKIGQIQLAVFSQVPEKEMKISLRGVSTHALRTKQLQSLDELRRHVGDVTGLQRNPRGLIVPAKDRPSAGANLKPVPFDNATEIACRTIQYYHPRLDADKGKRP